MDGSHSLLFRSDSSLALRCRKGAIHPIIQSPRPSSSLLTEVLGWRYGGRGRNTIAALTGGGVPLINNDRPGRWIGSGGVRTQRIEACFLLVAKPVIEFRQRGLHG